MLVTDYYYVYRECFLFNYCSPNVFAYEINYENSTITFHTIRFIGSDSISGGSIFSLSGKLIRISPYEKINYYKSLHEGTNDTP